MEAAEAAGAASVVHGRASDSSSRLAWAKFWLVATGVYWGVCMQLIFYQGAGHPMAMLPNLDWYVGMMLVYAGRLCQGRETKARYATVRQRHVLPIAVCDYIGTVGTTVGLVLSGSALFGIIYSSVTVWTALFTCLILRKSQTLVKMVGIATVVIGLALPTLDEAGDVDDGGASGGRVLAGILLTFVGTLFYALEYTLCERAFTLYDRPLDSKQLCFYTGVWGLCFTGVWMTAYTVPRWETLVSDEVARSEGSPLLLTVLFASHTLNNGLHNAAWFVVCELESGVSTGLLMGLKAAALFVASSVCFCKSQSPWPELLEEHSEQCMTSTKTLATAIVLTGTALYYWPSNVALPCTGVRAASGLPGWFQRRQQEYYQRTQDPATPVSHTCGRADLMSESSAAVPHAAIESLLERVHILEAENASLKMLLARYQGSTIQDVADDGPRDNGGVH